MWRSVGYWVVPMRLHTAVLVVLLAFSLRADVPLSLARYGVSPLGGTPAVASNGNDVVIAWSAGSHIRVLPPSARRGGTLIATPIADDGNDRNLPVSLAFNGSKFALVYQSTAGPAAAILDADGNLTAAPMLIDTDSYGTSTAPQVASDGDRFLVVYRVVRDQKTLYGRLLDHDGHVIGAPISIFSSNGLDQTVSVASNGDGFLVIDDAGIPYCIALDRDGKQVGQSVPDRLFGTDAAVATDGRDYLVTFRAQQTPHQLFAEVLRRDASARIATQTLDASPTTKSPAAWNGSSYVVATNEGGDIHLRHLTSDAKPLGDDAMVASTKTPDSSPAVALNVVAFEDRSLKPGPYPYAGGAVRAMSILPDNSLAPLPGLGARAIASIGAADQDRVAAATNAFSTLIVWREILGDTITHRFARIAAGNQSPYNWPDADGTVLRAQPESRIGVATNGDVFLLAWIEQQRVRITRVDRNGSLIDASPITIAEPRPSALDGNSAAVVAIGKTFVVIYRDNSELAATRVDPVDGHVIETRVIRPQIGFDTANNPIARWNGDTLVVAYTRVGSSCSRDFENICIISERNEAIVLDAKLQPKQRTPIVFDEQDGVASAPSIEWNGTHFVVAYGDYYDVKAFTLDSGGHIVGEANLIGTKAGDSHRFGWTAIGVDRGLFRIFASEETQQFVTNARAVTDVTLDANVNRTSPPNRRNVDFDLDAPAAAGPFVFYTSRVNQPPFYGAKRIQVVAPQQALAPPSDVQLTGSRVTWSYPSDAAGAFRIEARIGAGAFREVAMTSGDARSAVVDVPAGAVVRVRAWSIGGMSEYAIASPR